jgi:hypothetical protein
MLRRMCVSLAALALAAAPAVTLLATSGTAQAAQAAAASHPTAARSGGVALRLAAPGSMPLSRHHGGLFNDTSTNWSGYAAHSSTYTTVSATWVQPTGSCTSANRFSSFWVGLDGFNSNSVEQTGTDTDCSGGRPVYYGWFEMFPNPSFSFGSTVAAGDTMHASVSFSSPNRFTLTLQNVTRGWTATTTKTLSGAARSSAEVIIEAPSSSSGILPLANFGTVHLSNSLVNGSAIGNTSPTEITMVNNSGQSKDTVSSLSGGTAFSATWVRAS